MCAAIDQHVRIFKLQYHTANCHYYKNTVCKMKCVKENTKLNSPNNMDRNMYSNAHVRHPCERKDQSRWGLNSSYSPGRREFKNYTAPLNAFTNARNTKAGNEGSNLRLISRRSDPQTRRKDLTISATVSFRRSVPLCGVC